MENENKILAAIEQLSARLDKIEEKKTPFYVRIYQFVLQYRYIILAYVLGAVTILPFVSGGIQTVNPFRWSNPIIERQILDSPERIAAEAPNDLSKRKTVATACRITANSIRNGLSKDKTTALSELRQEMPNVLATPAWKKTTDRIEILLLSENDFSAWVDKLDTLASTFEK